MTANRAEKMLDFGFGRRRLPLLMQTEAAECGLACIAMIAGYYGHDTNMVSLRQRFAISSLGINLKKLMEIAAFMHLSGRALTLESNQISRLKLPCVLHWGMDHFVVLKEVKSKKIVIHDPARGERVVEKNEFDRMFTGVALELTPTSDFVAHEERQRLTLAHFWSKAHGLKRSLVQILLLSLLLQFFVLLAPLYIQTVVDDVLLHNDRNLLLALALGFGLLLLIEVGTTALRSVVIQYLSHSLNIQMAVNLFRHLIRLPMDYFHKRHMGDIVSRFGSLKNIRELMTTGMVDAVLDGLMAILTLTAMFFYSARLTLIVLLIVALYCLFRYAFYRPLKMLSMEALNAQARHDSHFMESVRAIQTLKLFQRENDRQAQWQNILADSINKNIRIGSWNILYNVINKLFFGLENLIVIYFAAILVMGNVMSLGMLFAFISYKTRFTSSVNGFIRQWIQMRMLDIHFERLADIAFTQAEAIDKHIPPSTKRETASGGQVADSIEGKIEVRNLSYRYSTDSPLILKNVSFIIEAGKTAAIIGPSGCGKTTLLKCLMGLLVPVGGEILVDGKPINQMLHYRGNIAGVMQDDRLLSGSIADNIGCFDPLLDMERVIQCAETANVHAEISNMPMGYNTLVGDMGSALSGGQKQRIVLARALYRRPSILFMDEATSHLDIKNESLVNDHIRELKITRVLVAHRPETIKSADREISLVSKSEFNN
jgi:ATP-binding cassette subfamily B protein RaxB